MHGFLSYGLKTEIWLVRDCSCGRITLWALLENAGCDYVRKTLAMQAWDDLQHPGAELRLKLAAGLSSL